MTKRRNDPLTADRADRARLAGNLGTSALPLTNARRAGNYRTQRVSVPGTPCFQLTPAQARRLRKKAKTLEGHAQAVRAGAYDGSPKSLTGAGRNYTTQLTTYTR